MKATVVLRQGENREVFVCMCLRDASFCVFRFLSILLFSVTLVSPWDIPDICKNSYMHTVP